MTEAPNFTLQSTEGKTVKLPETGKVVLFFYPKADTPGCTIETKKFNDLYPEFIEAGAFVFGISPDPHDKVCRFSEKYEFGVPLLADEDSTICEAYNVWGEKNFMGKKYMGVTRTTFLVQDGKIVQEWKHKPGKTEEEVLEAVKDS